MFFVELNYELWWLFSAIMACVLAVAGMWQWWFYRECRRLLKRRWLPCISETHTLAFLMHGQGDIYELHSLYYNNLHLGWVSRVFSYVGLFFFCFALPSFSQLYESFSVLNSFRRRTMFYVLHSIYNKTPRYNFMPCERDALSQLNSTG